MKVQSHKSLGLRGQPIPILGAFWPTAFVVVMMAAGCRQEPTTVSGSVSLDGRPLTIRDGTRGTVVFQPAGGGAILNGIIGPQGSYSLAAGSNSIVSPGSYTVTVSAVKIIPPSADNPQPSGERITPAKYATASESGLQVKVEPGPNDIDISMVSETDVEDDFSGSSETPADKALESQPPPVGEATQ